MKHPEPDALKTVYWEEINNTYKLLSYKFDDADEIKDGIVSL